MIASQLIEQVAKPGRPRSAQAENAILEATLDLIAECGPTRLSIEQVASRAGVGKTTVYRRWPDKHALTLDAIKHLKDPLPIPPGRDIREDLLYIVTSVRDQRNKRSAIVLKLLAATEETPDLVTVYREHVVRPRREILLNVLLRAAANGKIRSDVSVDIVAEMLVAPIITCGLNRGQNPTDEELATIVDILLRGLAVSS
jgi:AcrR family transcriptional regulator